VYNYCEDRGKMIVEIITFLYNVIAKIVSMSWKVVYSALKWYSKKTHIAFKDLREDKRQREREKAILQITSNE